MGCIALYLDIVNEIPRFNEIIVYWGLAVVSGV